MNFLNHYNEKCYVICPFGCESKLTRNKMKNHVDNDCSNQIVFCAAMKFGCKVKDKKSNILKHEIDCFLMKTLPLLNELENVKNIAILQTQQINKQNKTIEELNQKN